MNGTTALAQSLKELREFFHRSKRKYCLIGGLAANRWGEVRFTRDIDIVVRAEVGDEAEVVDELLAAFPSRLAKSEARQFALDNRVLLLASRAGVPIDVSLGALAFEEQMLLRAREIAVIRGQKFSVASPEDMIVMKTLAGRPQDWRDIEGIIVSQGDKLDWEHIQSWLDPLLETIGDTKRGAQLAELRQHIAPQSHSSRRARTRKKASKRRKPKNS